jgi:hypothetical protein
MDEWFAREGRRMDGTEVSQVKLFHGQSKIANVLLDCHELVESIAAF